MSEEQGNPAKKWYRKRSIIAELLILLVVFVIAVFIYLLRGEVPYAPHNRAYLVTEDTIQNAIDYYRDANNQLPVLNGTYTNAECSNCHILNISPLLGGLIPGERASLNLSASGNDNCGGNASLGCNNDGSYIWIVDNDGNVFSYCAGAGCTTNNSGYQDVWP